MYKQPTYLKKLIDMIDKLYDEIIIYDSDYNIVYVNQASYRHYGLPPEEMIGKSFFDFTGKQGGAYWDNSILPLVYRDRKPYAVSQKTLNASELFTIAVPIIENGTLTHVVMSVRDSAKDIALYHPKYEFDENSFDEDARPVAVSEKMRSVVAFAKKISNIDANCLITGESGTGKTLMAKYIHSLSSRKEQPFICLNCPSIPENLVESELFGYEKGAFTGANISGKKGIFEYADKGTILLDEISEIPLFLQGKLLQVIQEKKYMPVGGNKEKTVDVRILAATNRNLEEMVEKGLFREDLYFRLNVIEIAIPPLRERVEDIPSLCEMFMYKLNKKYSGHKQLSEPLLEHFMNMPWKGNVRELEHTLERLVVTENKSVIDCSSLTKRLKASGNDETKATDVAPLSFDELMNRYEAEIVEEAYSKQKSSRKLAKYLGISQTRANNLIKKHVNKE